MQNLGLTTELSYEQQHELYNQQIADNKQLSSAMAYLLMDLCEEGDNDANSIQELEAFNSSKIPSISIYDYLCRILKQAQCSQECLIMGLIFIDKLSQKQGRIILKSINVHRLYVVAVMLSAKFYDDRFFQNSYYAKVAGISHEEFNHLERVLVFLLDFKLRIDPLLYFTYRQRIITNYFDNPD
ncbi:unnamed protein product (macronuclear) [Paramecium tetraurelia]|uniref:Cyclin n=1 Tax=Paramecium tetraurelia TaxID=5888 RepID=A0BVQ0_PARTE|nr:uncharacterized protein GSPATT00032469001 [Paramecium tetraurelia]CAK62617.1 unnamed protein product [Paramecium tetraurelia]|eukprot:XP_001430015.1 hypothetical protein (macronuclear) [Paramecium tetraurelia strain d4-2]